MDKDLTNKGPWQEDDIQLPDQDAAWKNMEQKLDDDKRNKRIIPPFFIHCAGWSTLMRASSPAKGSGKTSLVKLAGNTGIAGKVYIEWLYHSCEGRVIVSMYLRCLVNTWTFNIMFEIQ